MTRRHRGLWRIGFVAVLICAGLTMPAAGRPQSAAPYGAVRTSDTRFADASQKARELIQAFMSERGVPGLSVAVGIDGRIVWSEGFGFANVEQGTPVTPLTRFRSGSVAKTITGAALGLVHEQGRLDLDAPIQKYVPSFPDKGYPITARQLAGHLAGFRHYKPDGDEFFSPTHYANVLDGLAIFKNDPLLFPPGTRYSYSSYGINLLGAVIQEGAHKDFLMLVQEQIFDALNMRSTTGDFVDRIIPYRTSYYERTGGKPSYHTRKASWGNGTERGVLLNGPYSDNSSKYPSGGVMTTPEDLVRFGSAHLYPGFLKAETLKMLLTSQRTTAGQETGYGMCWGVKPDPQGHRMYSHGGSSVGGTSFLLIYPDDRLVLAIQNNLTDANYQNLPEQIARLFVR